MGYKKSAEVIVPNCCNKMGRTELIKSRSSNLYSLDMEQQIKELEHLIATLLIGNSRTETSIRVE